MYIKDVMTPHATLVTPSTSLKDAASKMADY